MEDFTRDKWEQKWTSLGDTFYDPTTNLELRDSIALIRRFWPEPRTGRYLEAGCGPCANGLQLAMEGIEVVGVDYTESALQASEAVFQKAGLSATFVQGDLRHLPFKEGEFSFIYAGGVVEHFRETVLAISEMRRCLVPDGRVLLTVPALTLSYPYLALRGNVPAVPGAEQAAAFIHHRLLGGKHAIYGYERSFTLRRVRGLMREAGFTEFDVGRFDTYLPLLSMPKAVRPLARRVARSRPFAAMYWAVGTK